MDLLSSFFDRLEFDAGDSLDWEWAIAVFVMVTIVIAVGAGLSAGIKILIDKSVRTRTYWDDILLKSLKFPLTLLLWIIGFSYILELIWDVERYARLLIVSSNIRLFGTVLCFALFLLRFLSLGEKVFLESKNKQGKVVDATSVRAVNKILKAAVIITAVLMALNTLGFSISGILAFGGIGGIAVGFAAKDMLSNFFGGLMVYLDRPFVEGDWICSPDREIEGTVEYIGWRQTRIRTFARHPIYVPNSVFAQITIENRSRMECRRIYETIGVRYDDLSKVRKIARNIKKMLREHEEIDNERTLIVNLNQFGASSVDIMVYTFTKTTDWASFHEIKQDVMLKISGIIEQYGGEIAYPTRTLYLNNNAESERMSDDLPAGS